MIFKKCPNFNDLEDVFGHQKPILIVHTLDTESPAEMEVVETKFEIDSEFQEIEMFEATASIDSVFQTEPEIQADEVAKSEAPPAAKDVEQPSENDLLLEATQAEDVMKSRKGIYSSTALSDIMQVQTQLIKMKTKKHEMEVQLKERELELQKERFLFEKQSRLEEFKLKEKEIDSNEKLKIMEIQMKERIALKELEIKERIELEKVKHGIAESL